MSECKNIINIKPLCKPVLNVETKCNPALNLNSTDRGPAGENATINGLPAVNIEATGGIEGYMSGSTYYISGEQIQNSIEQETVKRKNQDTILKAQIDANADAILKTRNDLGDEINSNTAAIQELGELSNTIKTDLDDLGDQVAGIKIKIPGNASSSNQLATKSDIPTMTSQLQNNSDFTTKTYVDDAVQNITDGYQEADNLLSNRINSISSSLGDEISNHIDSRENPHQVTAQQVGLGNVDNTSDINKPISNATQNAIDALQDNVEIQINQEASNRQNADDNLQQQIDAIASSSDVVDVVGTYQDLQNYDTSKLRNNDIIKVLDDSTQNGAITYYRWVITDGSGTFIYIGLTGPYYTKSEADETFVPKTRTINGKSLANNITLTKTDIQLGNVNNTSDMDKPISTATQNALDQKASNTALNQHTSNTVIHVTQENKDTWNNKQNALTQSQLDAVNSGITANKISQIDGDISNTKINVQRNTSSIGGLDSRLSSAETAISNNNTSISNLQTEKQDILVSGTNIKTINGESVLGSGNLEISGGGSGGSGRNVGDIFYTTRLDTELNGAVECDGSTYNIGDFEGAESIGECLRLRKINYINFTQYDMQIENTGYCEFFAYERGETFKVPTLPTMILKGNQAAVVGNGTTLGLTDGSMLGGFATGTAVTGATGNQTVYGRPVGTTPSSTAAAAKFANNKSIGVTTDPTRSGLVANLDTVGVEYRAMVQLANSTTDEAVITVTATLQQLQDINEQIDTKIDNKIAGKQDILVSGTNIKTINGESVVGSGDIIIDGIKNKITNCITEIPQDIKLELNDGVLTLKAGSKVYVPNGAGVFDSITTSNDFSGNTSSFGLIGNGSGNIYVSYNNGLGYFYVEIKNESGTGTPTTEYTTYYNTSENKVYRYATSTTTPEHQATLPLGRCSWTNNIITSIDQVFNGFGYIGSTVFTLPNVKGLIPDGRNEDGTLKNIEFTTTGVFTTINPANAKTNLAIGISSDSIEIFAIYKYDETKNLNYDGERSGYFNKVLVATYDRDATGVVTKFNPKTTFRAVDANDISYVSTSAINKSANGYVKFSNGLIIQWGVFTGTSGKTVTLPTPFTTTNYSVAFSLSGGTGHTEYMSALNVKDYTTTSFYMNSTSKTGEKRWIAIGY